VAQFLVINSLYAYTYEITNIPKSKITVLSEEATLSKSL